MWWAHFFWFCRHFPPHLKEHLSHDILLMCVSCHQMADLYNATLKQQLAQEFGAPLNISAQKTIEDPWLVRVRNHTRWRGNTMFTCGVADYDYILPANWLVCYLMQRRCIYWEFYSTTARLASYYCCTQVKSTILYIASTVECWFGIVYWDKLFLCSRWLCNM